MCALSEKYGVYDIMLTDCVLPREWIQEFLPLLKACPHKFHIFQEIRCHLSAEDIELLAQCGYTYIQPGIESLSEHELKLMNKGISVMQNQNRCHCDSGFYTDSDKFRPQCADSV